MATNDRSRGPAVALRPADAKDVAALLATMAIQEVTRSFFGGQVSEAVMRECLENGFEERVTRNGESWVAATVDDEPVAYAALLDGILSFFVHPDHCRKRYASMLVETVCRRTLRGCPGQPVLACVLRENVTSVRILERLGFRFNGLDWQMLGGPLPLPILHFSLHATQATFPLDEQEPKHDY